MTLINPFLRKANFQDVDEIWEILKDAIERRRLEGSEQWQNGYPNLQTIKSDIEKNNAYVLVGDEGIMGYAALIANHEPAYENIQGEWLSDGDFLVVHRVAISEKIIGKGMAKKLFLLIEDIAKEMKIFSIKVDTNFDNLAMLAILDKLGYTYCGEVFLAGGKRKAFEKVL